MASPRRPLTGSLSASSRPSATRNLSASNLRDGDPSTVEKRELLAEEGVMLNGNGNGNGHAYGEKGDLLDDYEDGEKSEAGKRARSASLGQDGNEWEILLQTLKEVGRSWKRRWEKEGLQGIAPPIRHALTSARISSFTSVRSTIVTAFSILPPRRRFLVLLTTFLITIFLLFQPRSKPRSFANPYLKILTGSGIDAAIVDRTTGSVRGANKAKVLEGFSNPYGFINLIDPYAGGVFNPSVLVLPDTVGVGWRHLLVARGAEKYEVIEGEDTRWESVVGCFLLPLERPFLKLPYLARESELEVLKLPAERKMDFMRCHEAVYDQFIGPEDPRLFFTNDGQPLLIYSQTGRSPNICRAIYIIDARMVIPGLEKALKRGGWNPSIVFREQTDLIREDQFNIEKNWAPFLGENDELFFHVSVVPQQIYKYVPGLTLRALDPSPPSHNCITEIVGAEMNRVHFHHATPLLRVTLCRRGECVPDVHNTVLFGFIHIKYHPLPYLFYERRAITLNITSPYEYLSVSKPLTYSGTNQADPIFTTSAAWDHPTKKNGLGLNHGYLDDLVLVSFGVYDYGSAYIDLLARDVLTDHTMCTGVKGFEMW